FGHRGPGEMELASPRWRETPDVLPGQSSVERSALSVEGEAARAKGQGARERVGEWESGRVGEGAGAEGQGAGETGHRNPQPLTLNAQRPTLNAQRPTLNAQRPLLTRARRHTALREAGKHHLMLGYELLRPLLLELDRRRGRRGGIVY